MVFEDPSRGRRRVVLRVALAIVALCVLTVGLFALGQSPAPRRTPLPGGAGVSLPTPLTAWRAPPAPAVTDAPLSPAYAARLRALDAEAEQVARAVRGPALPLPDGARMVFSVNAPSSHASLRAHAARVSVVSPDWFRLPGPGCDVREQVDDVARIAAAHPAMGLHPRVANLDGDRWTSAETSALLADPVARDCAAARLASRAIALRAEGLNVDLEALAPEDSAGLVAFVAALRDRLHPRGLRVTVDVTFGDRAYDLARLAAVSDGVVLMAYDQHHPHSPPGPVATRAWIERAVRGALTAVPPERLVVALGAYAYDWPRGIEGRALGTVEALTLAARVGATPLFVQGAQGLRFDYRDPQGTAHEVWSLDATSLTDSLALLRALRVSRVALWRAGTEEPAVWPVLGGAAPTPALARVSTPAPLVVGAGEVVTRRSEAREGARVVRLDARGAVRDARFTRVPTPEVLERFGGDGARRDIALTFDDGPHPQWTPALLDALREMSVPAAFFVVGEQAQEHPEVVRRAAREGHLVASHTFHHPDMSRLDDDDYASELDRTTRLLEALAGYEVTLYRAPFTAFFDASDPASISLQRRAFDRGYAYVGADVDPRDWSDPDAARIAARMIEGVRGGGRVVVLHDGGGDRRSTVAAVRVAVPTLRAEGYRFVALNDYAGLPRPAMTPRLRAREALADLGAGAHAATLSTGGRVLAWLFTACTALAALRILLLAVIVLRDRRRPAPTPPEGFAPRVTVLVPAYNEAKVIASTVASLLRGRYANLEVLVVDDGSTDDTAAVVEDLARTDPRVRCLRRRNGGKARAANAGLREARGEIVVAVDADTVVSSSAIARMVAHFADPRVTAVCGNVEVGNVRSAFTGFQAVEYVTSQNFDRRAFAAMNCIGVVPGALGAWRRDAVLAVGGYSHDTLVEDADLTLSLLRAGAVITYEPGAIARTEAPETLEALWKQRVRWTYGTYQCLAKHRGALLRGTLGWVALPNLLLFQVLFPLVTPLGDLAMLYALSTGRWSALLSGYAGFLVMDLLASVLAFTLDRKPYRWLALLLVQRFVYRPLLCAVSLRAMLSAAVGARQGWRKLDRTGTVSATSLLPPRAA
jgi:peptidoglycan-N-acetylglucosamine deacetylase